jgi:hypothetical protein
VTVGSSTTIWKMTQDLRVRARGDEGHWPAGMVVRCECDAKKCENAKKKCCYSSAMRCDANFDPIFASHSHFALFCTSSHFRTFFAYFAHFSRSFHIFLPKRWKKCENAKKMRKVRCECEMRMRREKSAMRWALTKSANANATQKSFRTTIPGIGDRYVGHCHAMQWWRLRAQISTTNYIHEYVQLLPDAQSAAPS